MRNFDFKRYTPRPKKLLRASLNKTFVSRRKLSTVRNMSSWCNFHKTEQRRLFRALLPNYLCLWANHKARNSISKIRNLKETISFTRLHSPSIPLRGFAIPAQWRGWGGKSFPWNKSLSASLCPYSSMFSLWTELPVTIFMALSCSEDHLSCRKCKQY